MSPRDRDATVGRLVVQLKEAKLELERARYAAQDVAEVLRAVVGALDGNGVVIPLGADGHFEIQQGPSTSVRGAWPKWPEVADLIRAVELAQIEVHDLVEKHRDLGI